MKPEILKKRSDEFREDFYLKFGKEWELLTDFKKSTEYVTVLHKKCGAVVDVKSSRISMSNAKLRCPTCAKLNDFREDFDKRFGREWELLTDFKKYNEDVTIRHKPCGKTLNKRAMDISKTSAELICSECNKKERLIRKAYDFRKKFETELGEEWELLSDFKGSHETVTALHKPCGNKRTALAKEFFRKGCSHCEIAKAQKTRFKNRGTEYIHKIEEEYNVTSISEYVGAREPHRWRCNICGAEIERSIENILFRGNGYGGGIQCTCKKIGDIQRKLIIILNRRKRQLERSIHEEQNKIEISALCKKYQDNGYEIISVHDDLQHVTLKHMKCGRVYTTDKQTMRKGHGCIACSRCGTSFGVQKIEAYLREHDVSFEREVAFQSCKRERVLPFDFAIHDDTGALKCLIEFQGEQHYRASRLFGGKEKLQRVQEADAIKKQWANDNDIKLVVINWNDDIIQKLNQEI